MDLALSAFYSCYMYVNLSTTAKYFERAGNIDTCMYRAMNKYRLNLVNFTDRGVLVPQNFETLPVI